MRRNIHFNILLLLLLVEAISVRAVAQIPDRTLYQSISLDEYLKRVGEGNLNYLAEKLNVSIADAGNSPSTVVTEVIRIGRNR